MLLRSTASHRYKSAHKRFAKPAIEHFFEQEFPKMFGPNIRSVIADKLIEIFHDNFRDTKTLKPGQILWNAVHKVTRADSPNMKLVPVVLTIVNEEDVSKLENGLKVSEHKQNVIARLTKEAYAQNALHNILTSCRDSRFIFLPRRNICMGAGLTFSIAARFISRFALA